MELLRDPAALDSRRRALGESRSPWKIAAPSVPPSRPQNAPWPVARLQNMPSRNVANSGAFTNPNTSCSMSMMLLNCAAR